MPSDREQIVNAMREYLADAAAGSEPDLPAGTRISGRALVIRTHAALVTTHDAKGERYFFLPGGEPLHGESLRDAAMRETLEETGVSVTCEDRPLAGIVHLSPLQHGGEWQASAIFPAELTSPEGDAQWIDLDALTSHKRLGDYFGRLVSASSAEPVLIIDESPAMEN